MAWERAMYDTFEDYTALVKASVNMLFDSVIDAVTPDSEVAAQAKEVKRKVFEELRRRQENK